MGAALPLVTIENFPAVSRGPIGRALAEAQAHPGDPERVGHLGMVLQAWEQLKTAASVYTLARALERRYDWYHLEAVVQARLARPTIAATLLREAVALSPSIRRGWHSPRLCSIGRHDESAPLYPALATEPSPSPTRGTRRPRARCPRRPGCGTARVQRRPQPLSGIRGRLYAKGMALRARQQITRHARRSRGPRNLGRDGLPWMTRCVRACLQSATIRVPTCGAELRSSVRATSSVPSGSTRQLWPGTPPSHRRTSTSFPCMANRAPGSRARRTTERRYASALRARRPLRLRCAPGAAAPTCRGHERVSAGDCGQPGARGRLEQPGPAGGQAGPSQEALEAYRHAVERAPDDPTMRFNMARMLIATKQVTAAIPQFERLSKTEGPVRPRKCSALRLLGPCWRCRQGPAVRDRGACPGGRRGLAGSRGVHRPTTGTPPAVMIWKDRGRREQARCAQRRSVSFRSKDSGARWSHTHRPRWSVTQRSRAGSSPRDHCSG